MMLDKTPHDRLQTLIFAALCKLKAGKQVRYPIWSDVQVPMPSVEITKATRAIMKTIDDYVRQLDKKE